MANRTYYEILEVSPYATAEEIKEAYRTLSQVWHPDRFQQGTKIGIKATEAMKALNEAYEVLKDPQRRTEYDRYLKQQSSTIKPEPAPPPPPRFTPEQEQQIERNRERYLQALTFASLRKFCEAVGREDQRLKALAG